MSDQPPGGSAPVAGDDAPSPASPGGERVRRLLHRWFFSADRRYAMFQSIVTGTITNLITAGIIAGIAAAVGLLHISFHWSWHAYLSDLVHYGLPALVIILFAGIIAEWKTKAPISKFLGVMLRPIALVLIFTLVLTFVTSFHISINHGLH